MVLYGDTAEKYIGIWMRITTQKLVASIKAQTVD
jgi:hypothetical protein